MKRVLLALLCASLLVLSGCTEGSLSDLTAGLRDAGASLLAAEPSVPRISPVGNTPENLALFDALGANRKHDSCIFDFTAPEGAQQVVITQWELKDGQWDVFEADTLALTNAKGRLGFSWDMLYNDANVVLRTEETTFAVGHANPEWDYPTGEQTVTIFQSMDTEIVLDEEIPLLMQIITNNAEAPVIPLECWQETERYAEHADIRLVTVRFSTEPMEAKPPAAATPSGSSTSQETSA